MTTYYKQDNSFIFKGLMVAAMGLFLVACGESADKAETADETGSASMADASSSTASAGASTVAGVTYASGEIIDGVAFGDLVMGNPDAPITMIEYASLTCPHCAAFHNTTLEDIKKKYIATGQVKLVYRNLIANQYDMYASMIARCAGPEKAFGLMGLFFNRQSVWLQGDIMNNLASLARRAGVNRATFDQCLANRDLQADLLKLRELGANAGVTATPTFFINGEMLEGAKPIEEFEKAFADAG